MQTTYYPAIKIEETATAPFVWLDAIHYKVKEDGRYISKAVYTVLGVDMEGKKDILGLYLSESEGANHLTSKARL